MRFVLKTAYRYDHWLYVADSVQRESVAQASSTRKLVFKDVSSPVQEVQMSTVS